MFRTPLVSVVKGNEGLCLPTWLNENTVCNRLDRGITGYFRLVKKFWIFNIQYGKEFHGIIKGNTVESTERWD